MAPRRLFILQLALFGMLIGGFWQNSVFGHLRPVAFGLGDHAALSNPAAPPRGHGLVNADVVKTLALARGGTLGDLLVRAGAERADAQAAVAALKTLFDPRKLKQGQEIEVTLAPEAGGTGRAAEADPGPLRLIAINFREGATKDFSILREAQGFAAQETVRPLLRGHARASGVITDSLYLAALDAGVPNDVIEELIRLYSFDVDFQRDIQPGDRFDVFFERFLDEEGEIAKNGAILAASLTVGGKDLRLWRHTSPNGASDYFDSQGHSARKALLKTPVDGARLTSRFGRRHHPILGYSKMHQGVDFGAPAGTPIRAAGSGVVEKAGWYGAYGKYVRLRHNGSYSTAYAHMNRIAVNPGSRVTQGQVIGAVGSTGRSTGPHLHYEILHGGKPVNPLKVKLPTGRKLAGEELANFLAKVQEIEMARLASAPVLASR
jgi:murein DD-endopeptidase MepM/ murein hydrolase activator NlpD